MKSRLLGGSGLKVSAVGFGMMGLTVGYGTNLTRKAAVNLLREAHNLGVNFFDAAEAYGARNEGMLAEAFAPVRDQVVYATKFGWRDGKPLLSSCYIHAAYREQHLRSDLLFRNKNANNVCGVRQQLKPFSCEVRTHSSLLNCASCDESRQVTQFFDESGDTKAKFKF